MWSGQPRDKGKLVVQPLKILILARDPDVFSNEGNAPNDTHERHLYYVSELQRRRPGSEVRIIAHTRRPGKFFEAPRTGLQIYGTNSRSRLHCTIDVARQMLAFRREGWVPDVISCQTGYEEAPLALCLRDPKSRVQVQLHNDFYGHAFGDERFSQRIQRTVIRWSVRRCDQARVVARGIARQLVNSGDIEADRIAVAPVPIMFQAVQHCASGDRRIVLFVGRLVAQKDLRLWCDAAEIVHRAVPEAEFWLVGEGPDRELLERRMPSFGGKMRLFGAIAYGQLAPIFAKASVFLLTSAYEGLGRVVVEAMLAGVPVVSADIIGPQDLIEDRKTGRLVHRDAASLAEATIEILRRPDLGAEIGTAGLDWARGNYALEAVTAELVESWEKAATLPRRQP
jgi:glycosyltransferase involved in cell wall biosynthesis